MSLAKRILITITAVILTSGGILAGKGLLPHIQTIKQPLRLIPDVQEGDIIFQISTSDLSKAIQLATHSKYSHCGIIFKRDNEWYVYEAIQPVCYTPLQQWIARGKNGHYVIKRLRNATAVLTPDVISRMKKTGEQFKGKDYDFYFGWSDERIYCSELVWKIYKSATGLEIGKLQELRDFDLKSPEVKAQMKKIYGNNIPLSEKIISPISMFESPALVTVDSL